MGFGARWGRGCTSGHGISGGLQLAVSSWTFFFVMFASGVATAFLLFAVAFTPVLSRPRVDGRPG